MRITWHTAVSTPCCPGEIVAADGQSRLIQTDWGFPGVAQTFGWSLERVQRCLQCGGIGEVHADGHAYCCETWPPECPHKYTDGTVLCPDCGVKAGEFIASAGEWLREHDGATADDHGYFGG
jgi:hypothetical protein